MCLIGLPQLLGSRGALYRLSSVNLPRPCDAHGHFSIDTMTRRTKPSSAVDWLADEAPVTWAGLIVWLAESSILLCSFSVEMFLFPCLLASRRFSGMCFFCASITAHTFLRLPRSNGQIPTKEPPSPVLACRSGCLARGSPFSVVLELAPKLALVVRVSSSSDVGVGLLDDT